MEQGRKWFPYLITALLLSAVIYLILKENKEPENPGKITKDTTVTAGKLDSTYEKGKSDTTIKYVPYPYPVYVERPSGTNYQKDSSRYIVENDRGRAEITTYPATDSIHVSIEPIAFERLIFQIDTLKLFQHDTMVIHTTETINQPWYNTFLSGFVTAILAVAGVIGAFAL